jgi:hypothetical protein
VDVTILRDNLGFTFLVTCKICLKQCPNMKISQMRNLMFCRCVLMTSLTFGSHCVVVMESPITSTLSSQVISYEGWEHLNYSIAYFYFNRTQRGGSAGTLSCEASQKVRPIGLWFLTRLFWTTDRAELTGEVIIKMGREIRKEKKVKQLVNELATVQKVEETKEDSENSYSDTDEDEEEYATEAEFENTLPL